MAMFQGFCVDNGPAVFIIARNLFVDKPFFFLGESPL
jgi:hypothetical protein